MRILEESLHSNLGKPNLSKHSYYTRLGVPSSTGQIGKSVHPCPPAAILYPSCLFKYTLLLVWACYFFLFFQSRVLISVTGQYYVFVLVQTLQFNWHGMEGVSGASFLEDEKKERDMQQGCWFSPYLRGTRCVHTYVTSQLL